MTEMAACRATSEQVKTIEEVLEKMKTDEYRLETFADYDFMFHKSIADASGNKVFSMMMESIRPMLYSHIIIRSTRISIRSCRTISMKPYLRP